ncbi:MAG: TRAP transporter small permease [Gammaproteobacteria bacterium]|nr:TRAP transporter small permease [Gammaproteobacteria bacterium]
MKDPTGPLLVTLDRFVGKAENAFNLVAGGLIFGLMVLGVVQIVMRTVFSSPILGYIDIVELSMVGFAVLAIAFVQRVGGHVRMELVIQVLRGRTLWFFEALGSCLAIFIVAVLIPYSFDHFQRAFQFGDSTIDLELATWPAKLVVPMALSLLLVRLVIQLAGYTRLFVNPRLPPLAIPALKRPEEVAAAEIRLTETSGGIDDDAATRA